jgi:hypothetical protein
VSLADTEGVAGLAGRAGLAGFWPDDNAQRSATMPSNDRDQGRPRGLGLVRRSPVTLYGSEGWGFESLRARPAQRPLPILLWPELLPNLAPKGAIIMPPNSSSIASAASW